MDEENSPISSTNSSSYPSLSSSSFSETRTNLSTDLRLGLSLSYSSLHEESSNARQQLSDWPPIKPHRRSMLKEKAKYIKVYMEGVTIGRKLDLCAFDGYESLITALRHMFRTNISYADVNKIRSSKAHVLTYEDQEGDWMLVGDVPWELFLNTVKRLKITRADRC